MGDLIPFYIDSDILPADTMRYHFSCVIRQTTSISPTMDDAIADVYFIAVPWRLTWDSTKEFFGENKTGAWYSSTEKLIPQLETPTGGAQKGTIMDYCGIPLGIAGLKFNALPIRAITLAYNELFRDQNLIAPDTEYHDDTDRTASNTVSALGGVPYKVAKTHDYFTSALPSAQKGPAVTIPVGASSAPVTVFGDGKTLGLTNGTQDFSFIVGSQRDLGVNTTSYNQTVGYNTGTSFGNVTAGLGAGVTTDATKSGLTGIADLSSAFSATINAQRLAYQTQRILEKDARGGTRYIEIIANHFLTTSPDARQQRPEYLGGKRFPINMTAVPQTGSTDAVSPQGNLAAYSHTVESDFMFTKSFTEHTIIIGFICVRTLKHTYNQGLARQWSRRRRLDVYWPALCHLGEQAILNKEIYAQGPSAININTGIAYDEETFGFQERWAEYRQKNNMLSGAMRTTYATSLDFWHMGDDYSALPVLSQQFIEETPNFLDRTLAVAHTVEDQYLMDGVVNITATRPMSLHSIPGLVDHF